MVRVLITTFGALTLTAVCGCTRLSPTEAKLVGTWGVQSISGEINSTYAPNHRWTTEGVGDRPLKGRWWIEGDQLVSYLEPPKEYAEMPMFDFLRERRRAKILAITMKQLTLMSDGKKCVIVRMQCPRCRARLGSFATERTLPTRRSSCPSCGLKLEDV